MQPRLWICAVSLLIAAPAVAAAQAVTGSLEGRVLSDQGEPLELVTVTARGPFLQGARTVTSDASGHYEIQALPPGEYELRLTLIGYRPLTIQRAMVELGSTTGLEAVAMSTQSVELEPIAVTAQAISIDPEHTTVGGTLTAADYASLPVDRDYKSLIRVLPHANESTRGDPVNVGGSTGLENQYYIDGVNVTDTRDASRATSLPYNFVRAVEVKTGGYEAMYGRALGAVVNAVTYSGTNDFEANVFGFVRPDALALSPREMPAVAQSGAVGYDVGGRVSGPILRDRLWYSAALNPRVDRVEKEIVGYGIFADRTTAVRFAGKLTWRASSTTGLELSVFGDPTTQDAVGDGPPAGLVAVANPDPLLFRQASGGVVASLRAVATPSPSVLLEASVARQWDRYSLEGGTAYGRGNPMLQDYVTQTVAGGFPWHQHDDRGRTSAMARVTVTIGAHAATAGVEYEDALVASDFAATGIGVISRLDTALYLASYQAYSGRFHNRSPAAYLQDSWRVGDRLTLNLGLRCSGQFFTGASGRVVQEIPDEWQPRAGFSWQVGRLGTQRVLGSYGRVYETLPDNLAVLLFVDYTYVDRYYSSDPRQPSVPVSVVDGSTTAAQTSTSVPGLHGDNFDEFTLGYERLLGSSARLTARGVYRHLRSSYQVGWDFSRTPNWALGTPGQGSFDFLPPPRRDYTALELAAEGTWHRLRFRASYVLSRTWGNYPGLYSSDMGFNAPGINAANQVAEQGPNSSGLLPNDRTHVVKVSAAYGFGAALEVGAFVTAQSGSPINAFAPSPVYGVNAPIFLVPRGSAGRTPALWNVDLRLAYALPLAGGARSRIVLDALHVGNPRRATWVDEVRYTTLDANGDPASPNPQYGQPIAYQAPMAARLGVEIGF